MELEAEFAFQLHRDHNLQPIQLFAAFDYELVQKTQQRLLSGRSGQLVHSDSSGLGSVGRHGPIPFRGVGRHGPRSC